MLYQKAPKVLTGIALGTSLVATIGAIFTF